MGKYRKSREKAKKGKGKEIGLTKKNIGEPFLVCSLQIGTLGVPEVPWVFWTLAILLQHALIEKQYEGKEFLRNQEESSIIITECMQSISKKKCLCILTLLPWA